MNIGADDYNLKFKYTFLNQINDKLKKLNNRKSCCYNHIREILAQNNIYIPEDV